MQEKHLPDDWFQVQINGDTWTIYLIEDEDTVIADSTSGAETDFDNREIHVRRAYITPHIIKHELYHAFAGYCYLGDTSISVADAEEVAAALFADRAQTILNTADLVYKKLTELRDAK